MCVRNNTGFRVKIDQRLAEVSLTEFIKRAKVTERGNQTDGNRETNTKKDRGRALEKVFQFRGSRQGSIPSICNEDSTMGSRVTAKCHR